ncbi:ATPase [Marinobacter salinexigens]|uniref:ATPase n=1 Tax=Marinobacter salinexigens TaxID=2919747 RepID=A0A5B0VNG0_9GAMM|nr:SRPBCC domain-containing protein [Marinobacter salinexigens]KAA1175908.1 ATPase [Marinobacter salinexigens]
MAMNEPGIGGLIEKTGDRVRVQLERETGHAPEQVWQMLTDSVYLGQWLAPGSLEPREGGRVQVDFGNSGTPIDCLIQAWQPNRLLAYSWSAGDTPERPLTWELIPRGQGTLLTLTLSLPLDGLVAISCAGWDSHLEMLMAALEGISISFPAARFRQARSVFERMVQERLAA